MKKFYSAQEYRDWLIGCLRKFGHSELVSLICPMGEDSSVKLALDYLNQSNEEITNKLDPYTFVSINELLKMPVKAPDMTLIDSSSWIPPACRHCPNHPINGGSGICNCTLGALCVTY